MYSRKAEENLRTHLHQPVFSTQQTTLHLSRTIQLVTLLNENEKENGAQESNTPAKSSGFSLCICGEGRGHIITFTVIYSRLLARLAVPQLETSLSSRSGTYPMRCSQGGGSQHHSYRSCQPSLTYPSSATTPQQTLIPGEDSATHVPNKFINTLNLI